MSENIFKKMDVKGIVLNDSYTKKYNEILDKSIEKFENEVNKNNDLLKIIGDKGAYRVKSFSIFSDKLDFIGFSINLDTKNICLNTFCNSINLHSEAFLINQLKLSMENKTFEFNKNDNLYSEVNFDNFNKSESLIGVLHSTPCVSCSNEIINFNRFSDKKIKTLLIGYDENAIDPPSDISKNSEEGILYNDILYKGKEVISVLKLLLDNGITPIIHNKLKVGDKTIFLKNSKKEIIKIPKNSDEEVGFFDDDFYIVTYKTLEKFFEKENSKSFIKKIYNDLKKIPGKEFVDVIFTYVFIPLAGFYIAIYPSLTSPCDPLFTSFAILMLGLLFLILRIFIGYIKKIGLLVFIVIMFLPFSYICLKIFLDSDSLNTCITTNQK